MTVFFMSMVMVMGPTPPGTGSNEGGFFLHGFKIHVAGQFGFTGFGHADAVDAHVDDHGAFFDPVGLNILGHAGGNDEDISPFAVFDHLVFGGAGMDAGDGAVGAVEFLDHDGHHGFAHDIGTAHHDNFFAFGVAGGTHDELLAAGRGAGQEGILADEDAAHVHRDGRRPRLYRG